MSARQVRVETRSRHQSDLKRVMHSTAKVRKWVKKWVQVGDTSMQIFKWIPIKADEQQQASMNKIILNETETYQQEPRREILAPNSNQMNSATPASSACRSDEKTKTLLNDEVSESYSNGSHTDERVRLSQTETTLSNNFTSMRYQHSDEHRNKRKLDELELISSDSCGSSSCSSANDVALDSNSNSAHDELEGHLKRQKRTATMSNGSGDGNHFDMLQSRVHSVPTSSIRTTDTSPFESSGSSQTHMTSHKDEEMMVVDSKLTNSTPTNSAINQISELSGSDEICMDSEEDLTNAARLVTEQIITRVADCYMNI